MENGDETFASPTAAAAEFEQTLTNGGGADEDLTATHHTKSYYDGAEIDALREAKRDLEEKLAAVGHENNFLAAEAHRLEGLVSQAREEIATAEHAVAASEDETASLRAEVKRLQDLLASEKSDHDAELRKGAGIGAELQNAHQEKVALEEEIKALKAPTASAAAAEKKEETAAPSIVAPKEAEVASHGLVAAAAAGAAATAAIAVVFLHLKR